MKLNFTHAGTQSFFTSEKVIKPFVGLQLPCNHQFAAKRFVDFSTGRYCAKMALEQLDIKDVIIPIGKDREPIWPEGIVGSISHCDSFAGAIVAKSAQFISLGMDIEEIGRVTPDLWDLVFTQKEKDFLISLSYEEIQEKSTAIFSIKEAFYKFQHPLTKTFLDFLDVEVNTPNLNSVIVISELIPSNSVIRKNTIDLHVNENNLIAVVTP